MTQPIGEEWIRIRPDLSGFRSELQSQLAAAVRGATAQTSAQLGAAMRGATSQAAAAQTRLVGSATGTTTGGLSLATATSQQGALTRTTRASQRQLAALSKQNQQTTTTTKSLSSSVREAETSVGRYTRGMVAATAASTGFFRAVAFASGSFLVGAAIGATIGAAVNEFTEMTRVGAQTAAVLKATGESANVTAAQVDALAKSQLALTGIDDELVKSSANVLLTFRSIRNEVGEGNAIFTRAVKAVSDISSVFKTDLRGSAVQLGKALQDPIRGVTALRRSGITLSQSQRDLIKAMVESGRILSAQKVILGEVERQVGGTAEAVGRTLPGRLRILREQSVNALGEYVTRITESKQATDLAATATAHLGQAVQGIKSIVSSIGPPLLAVAKATGQVTSAVGGVGAILGAVVAYKALAATLRVASAAQVFYMRATQTTTIAQGIGRVATLNATAANALLARSALFAATSQVAAAAGARVAAVAYATLGISARAAAVALSLVGGIPGAVILGITALTIGLIKLKSIADRQPGSLRAVAAALDDLNDAVKRGAELRGTLAGRQEDIGIARFNVQAAQRGVAAAQAAASASRAQQGSLEQIALANRLTVAEEELKKANDELREAEKKRDIVAEQVAQNERGRQQVIQQTTRDLQRQIDAIKGARVVQGVGILRGISRLFPEDQGSRVEEVRKRIDGLAASTNNVKRRVGEALQVIQDLTGATTSRELQLGIVVQMVARDKTTNQILAALGLVPGADTEQIRLRGLQVLPPSAQIEQERLAQKAIVKTLREKRAVAHDNLRTQREETKAARDAKEAAEDALKSAQDALKSARRSLQDAIVSLRDTIVSSQQAIADAIRDTAQATREAIISAQGNLESLGQTLAGFLGEAQDVLGGRGTTVTPGIAALRERVRRGEGGPETQRAAQQIAFRLSDRPQKSAEEVGKALEKLSRDVQFGVIKTMPQLNKAINAAIKGFDLKQLAKLDPGLAAAISSTIAGIRRQAAEIFARGGGPAVTKAPFVDIGATIAEGIKTVAAARVQSAKDIARASRNVRDAEEAVADAVDGVAKAENNLAKAINALRKEQVKEQRALTKALTLNTKVQNARLKLERVGKPAGTAGNAKRKPQGRESQQGSELVIGGAQSP